MKFAAGSKIKRSSTLRATKNLQRSKTFSGANGLARSSTVRTKKWIRTPNKRSASAFPGLAFPKVFTEHARRERASADETYRQKVRVDLFARVKTCMVCHTAQGRHDMHEDHARGQTRGMAPERRYDLRWVLRVCRKCHRLLTDNAITIGYRTLLGALGPIKVFTGPGVKPPYYSALEVWEASA